MVEFSAEIKSEVKRYILRYGVDDWVFTVFAYAAVDKATDEYCYPLAGVLLAEVIPEMIVEGLVEFSELEGDWRDSFTAWDIPLEELKKWLEDFARQFPDKTLTEGNTSHDYDYRLGLTAKGEILGQKYLDERNEE